MGRAVIFSALVVLGLLGTAFAPEPRAVTVKPSDDAAKMHAEEALAILSNDKSECVPGGGPLGISDVTGVLNLRKVVNTTSQAKATFIVWDMYMNAQEIKADGTSRLIAVHVQVAYNPIVLTASKKEKDKMNGETYDVLLCEFKRIPTISISGSAGMLGKAWKGKPAR